MARKKVARKKAVAKKNPTMAMKDKLAKMTAELKAVKAAISEVAKRTSALEKATVPAPAKKAPARKKAAAKKKTAKRRSAARKKK